MSLSLLSTMPQLEKDEYEQTVVRHEENTEGKDPRTSYNNGHRDPSTLHRKKEWVGRSQEDRREGTQNKRRSNTGKVVSSN